MTQEAKKRPINRLQSMYALRAVQDKNYQLALEAKKEGRPVAWCMAGSFAEPFLEALGIESVYPENYGPVCAATGAAQTFLARCDAEGFPNHMCGYLRNCLGYAARMVDCRGEIPPESPGTGMPKPMLLMASGILCDTRFKCFQALGRYLDVPMYTMEVPMPGAREALMEGVYERNVNLLVNELKELAAFLERLVGKKIDWGKFEAQIDGVKEMDAVWYGIGQLRKARPCPMHARDHFSSILASFFRATNPKAVKELYQKLYEEVKERVDNGIAGINREEKYRLWMGSIPPWHSMGFFDQLAERGWNFVLQGYQPPNPIDVSMYSDPVERYIRYRYQGLEQMIDFDSPPEEAARIKNEIKRQGFSNLLRVRDARDFQCDGVFIHPVLTCRPSSQGTGLFQSQLMEELKVPALIIEGDLVDITLFDPVDALRKAEAFEETMDYYKEVRKKAGMAW